MFWGAFLLFSITTASIISGSIIERARSGAFWIIAVLIGSVLWILDASWGWHPQGWMVKLWGYHDAYASGVVHAIAGGAALAFLIVLGPRIGKFRPDGTPRDIPPHNVWLVTIGLFLIYTGFWGFYAACNIPIISPAVIAGQITGETWTATNIYLAPTTLSAITFNFLMSLSGGMMAGYLISKGDPFWTFSAGPMRRHQHVRRQRSLSSDPGNADRRDRAEPSATSCTTSSNAASRSTMRWAPSPCTAMAASSAWLWRASCCGDSRPRPMKASRTSIRSAISPARC